MDEARKSDNDAPAPAAAPGEDAMAAETGATAEDQTGQSPLDELAADNARLKDQLLRTLAEMENLRRRTEREVADARTYAVANFARDMLGVGDNLRRAIDALPAQVREGAEATLKTLLEGVELTERELLNTLAKHKVTRIDPLNERFDPNFHQAMFEVPNPDIASGTVVQVMQAGYIIGERVLRPALVGVAKGGPKPARDQAAQPQDAVQPAEKAEQPDGGNEADAAAQAAQRRYAGEPPKGTHYDKNA